MANTLAASLPSLSVSLSAYANVTVDVALNLPLLQSALSASVENRVALAVQLPTPLTSTFVAGENVLRSTLPKLTSSVSGLVSNAGALALQLPGNLSVSMSAYVSRTGTLAGRLTRMRAAAVGGSYGLGSTAVKLTVLRGTISAVAYQGTTLDATLPEMIAALGGHTYRPAALRARLPKVRVACRSY